MNELNEIMNQEIARELILEINPQLTDDEFDNFWPMCKGKPFDAPILYKIKTLMTVD